MRWIKCVYPRFNRKLVLECLFRVNLNYLFYLDVFYKWSLIQVFFLGQLFFLSFFNVDVKIICFLSRQTLYNCHFLFHLSKPLSLVLILRFTLSRTCCLWLVVGLRVHLVSIKFLFLVNDLFWLLTWLFPINLELPKVGFLLRVFIGLLKLILSVVRFWVLYLLHNLSVCPRPCLGLDNLCARRCRLLLLFSSVTIFSRTTIDMVLVPLCVFRLIFVLLRSNFVLGTFNTQS